MSFLTGPEIVRRRALGEIVIDPFDPAHVNPNSYDLTLSQTIGFYAESKVWDVRTPPKMETFEVTGTGLTLRPGVLYIASTVEKAGSDHLVPIINGKSSLGRLGIAIHVTAGFGDIGFVQTWTLEITCVHPVKIYPGMRICQISFQEPVGEIMLYRGKYDTQSGPTGSKAETAKSYYVQCQKCQEFAHIDDVDMWCPCGGDWEPLKESIPKSPRCPNCGGGQFRKTKFNNKMYRTYSPCWCAKPVEPAEPVPCPKCSGTGEFIYENSGYGIKNEECRDCNGGGVVLG